MRFFYKIFSSLALTFLFSVSPQDWSLAATPAVIPSEGSAYQQARALSGVKKIRHSEVVRIYNERKPESAQTLRTLDGIDPWVYIFSKPPKVGNQDSPVIEWSLAPQVELGNAEEEEKVYEVASSFGDYLVRFPNKGLSEPQAGYAGVGQVLIERNTTGEFEKFQSQSYTVCPAMQAAYNQTIDLGLEPEIFWFTSSYYEPRFANKQIREDYETRMIRAITQGKFRAFNLRVVPLNKLKNPLKADIVLSEMYLRNLTRTDGQPFLSEGFWELRERQRFEARLLGRNYAPWNNSLDRRELKDRAMAEFKENMSLTKERIDNLYLEKRQIIENKKQRGEISQEEYGSQIQSWNKDKIRGYGEFVKYSSKAEKKFRNKLNRFLREEGRKRSMLPPRSRRQR